MRQLSDVQRDYERLLNVCERFPPAELIRLKFELEALRDEAEQRRAMLRYQLADRVFNALAGNRATRRLGESSAHLLWRLLKS
jgi:hypothetical protein